LGVKNIVVFASGSGTNFQAIIDAVKAKSIDADITGLITNKSNIPAIDRASNAGIPCRVILPSQYSDSTAFGLAILDVLDEWKPDLIVLAGYMIKVPNNVTRQYRGRIINIHPALLPGFGGKGFYGERVHRAVLEAGEQESGCTVHYVDEDYDRGPIIAQKKVPVLPGDTPQTLAERILHEEHQLLPTVIQQLLSKL
jgi:phosphoribosylglycinamide formyltransferase 1